MKPIPDVLVPLAGKLLVSCQASPGDAFRDSASIARFARAAVDGGAAGIRADGPEDVRAIRAAVPVPIVGIQKSVQEDGRILITPSVAAARALVEAGARLVALDCTARGQRYGALDRLRRIRAELGVPVLADIATVEEAEAAADAGADAVLSTMRGYTEDTAHVRAFEPAFIHALKDAVEVPVIAEGRIVEPSQAAAALDAGAFAVIVGTAITRPHEVTRWFAEAMRKADRAASFLGIDLGGTNTKFGIVSGAGELTHESFAPTPAAGGRAVLLEHLKAVARQCVETARAAGIQPAALGVATAGWVDNRTGQVVYATDNLPGWTGTPLAEELRAAVGLPVAAENDANALAVAERHFGLGRDVENFACITLGTGVGGGCYVNGRLNRGAHFFANAFGHMSIQPEGLPCNCGQRGCLEVYANAAALVRYAGGAHATAEDVIRAANAGESPARAALRTYSGYLARGCAALIHLLDPQRLIFSGGLAQNNPALVADLEEELARLVTVWDRRGIQIRLSPLAYYGGVLGAAAIAREAL